VSNLEQLGMQQFGIKLSPYIRTQCTYESKANKPQLNSSACFNQIFAINK